MNILRNVTVAAFAAFLLNTAVANAALVWDFNNPTPISVADLQSQYDGEILVGDKLFNNFFISTGATTSNTVVPPTAASINLSGTESNGDFGIVFNAAWQVRPGETVDTLLQFKVTATDPLLFIHDNTLAITGQLNSTNLGSVSVSESVYYNKFLGAGGSITQDPLAIKQVYYISPLDKNLFDHQIFIDPLTQQEVAVKEAWIVKDVLLTGGALIPGQNETGVVALSGVVQTFSQIPEPATMALFGLGGVTMLAGRRRKA